MASTDSEEMERPVKRQKLEARKIQPLPQDVLLLSLPHILAHPPTHRNHSRSVYLSIIALRKFLSTPNLDQHQECRAWTELAEAGFRLGLETPGIENEVERAITKALMISTKHPSLRMYKPQITYLSARLAMYHGNVRLAQNALKKVVNNFIVASDPPHVLYAAHLAYIDCVSASAADLEPATPSRRHAPPNASSRTASAIKELHTLAMRNNHREVALFAMVLELLDFVQNGVWNRIEESLRQAEKDLDIAPHLLPDCQAKAGPLLGKTNIGKVLIVHVLVLGVLYHTYTGDYANSQTRLKILHDMLDGGALEAFGISGIVDIDLANSPQPLQVQVTHPRVIYGLGFLVSSVSKRDPVGRRPKRRVYANEGIVSMDKELKKEIALPIWASRADVKDLQERILLMKADMTCELIGIAISRSEFDEAEEHISRLIADTRSHGLFHFYSARITLHHAHLAHGQGHKERALQCYQVAAHLSRTRGPRTTPLSDIEAQKEEEDAQSEDLWVNVSARAGELWLRIGMANELEDEAEREKEMEVLRPKVAQVVKLCQGLGGTLQTVGEILSACSSKEYLVTKTHLRTALNLSTAAQDNHLRALVLALMAAQYVHTSTEHAETMLSTAEQLAAGLGALPKAAKTPEAAAKKEAAKNTPGGDGIGNAHLRLWIGERSLEIKRRTADERAALKQINLNRKFLDAVQRVEKRKFEAVD
ncbi:hypothetical protein D9613_012585 [Agrocybe pediades]|uniref:Uncharacterized protein n=1 Tax=Agrocybe pediades TaxID=84607 RepID=A0A8H4R2F2_9AGAR|nr:hypothetical protein D9613_012585 [Agrocybe pediades]